MALPPSTANWHWKNKNITRWGSEWIERELPTVSVTGDQEGEEVSISSVTEVDGDIELGQRKSKLITIFDCKVVAKWQGTTSDGSEVLGTVTIPEVSHEIICDKLSDFIFNWTLLTKASPEVNSIFALARTRLAAAVEAKFATLPAAIVEAHAKDLQVSADPSRTGTPANATSAPAPTASTSSTAAPVKSKSTEAKKVNTTTVTVEADFRASADDLYSLLTDEKRIPAWTRAPAQSEAKPDTEYSLFGGGVKGKYITLTPQKEIVQTWALQSPTWPTGHAATLTTTLDQSSESTKVVFTLVGVPLGTEEEIKRNLEGYYIHGFKSIGYVHLIPTQPVYSSSYVQNQSKMARGTKTAASAGKTSIFSSFIPAVAIAGLVLVAAFTVPYLSGPALSPVSSAKLGTEL